MPSMRDRLADLELAASALAALVRQEYPDSLSLAEIARRWGVGITPDQLAALASVENLAPEASLSVNEKAPDVGEIEPC